MSESTDPSTRTRVKSLRLGRRRWRRLLLRHDRAGDQDHCCNGERVRSHGGLQGGATLLHRGTHAVSDDELGNAHAVNASAAACVARVACVVRHSAAHREDCHGITMREMSESEAHQDLLGQAHDWLEAPSVIRKLATP